MQSGDYVDITGGDYEGMSGRLIGFDPEKEVFVIALAELQNNQVDVAWGDFVRGDKTVGDDNVPEYGMTTGELSTYVANFINEVVTRIVSVGDDRYSNATTQDFEVMDLEGAFDWMSEELGNVAAAAAMLDIRVKRVKHALTSTMHYLTDGIVP